MCWQETELFFQLFIAPLVIIYVVPQRLNRLPIMDVLRYLHLLWGCLIHFILYSKSKNNQVLIFYLNPRDYHQAKEGFVWANPMLSMICVMLQLCAANIRCVFIVIMILSLHYIIQFLCSNMFQSQITNEVLFYRGRTLKSYLKMVYQLIRFVERT